MNDDDLQEFAKIKWALKSAYEDGFPVGVVKGRDGVAHLLISAPSSIFSNQARAALSASIGDEIKFQLFFRAFDFWLEPVVAVVVKCVPLYVNQALFTVESRADSSVRLVPSDSLARHLVALALK